MQATDDAEINEAGELQGEGGDSPASVEVKGWRNGLLLFVPFAGEWETVLAQVDSRLDEARARSFWRGAQVTLICGSRAVSLGELSDLCERVKGGWGLVPVAVVSSEGETRAAGEKLALVAYEELPVVKMPERRERTDKTEKNEPAPEPAAAPPNAHTAPGGSSDAANALYVRQTVRSGQRVVHEGNVVVCGDVNAGAEVIAGGDVLVFGTLRGLAHAGSFGNESARIIAVSLRPPQLRIAQKIARAPEDEVAGSAKGAKTPEVARIENGEINVFPL